MEERLARFGIDPFRGQVAQIWQGTILECRGALGNERKLVVSADCDLAHDKGAGEFFALDIFGAQDFAAKLICGDAKEELVGVFITVARDIAKARNSSFGEVSDEVLVEWLIDGNERRWSTDLPNLHQNDIELMLSFQTSVARLLAGTGNSKADFVQPFLIASPNIQLSKYVEQINKRLKAVLQKRLDSKRADLYIFPALPGEEKNSGHIVPFNSLALVHRERICLSKSELVDRPSNFVPKAVCRPILIQSLLQKMMLYFIRIGITDSFKSEQEKITKDILEQIK